MNGTSLRRWRPVQDALQAVRSFLQPISDDELPEVQKYILRMTRAFAATCATLVFTVSLYIVPVSNFSRGSMLLDGVVFPVSMGAAMASIYFIARSAWGERHPQVGIFLITLVALFATAYDGILSRDLGEGSPFVDVLLTVSLAISTFTPWKPVYSLITGVIAAFAHHYASTAPASYSYLFAGTYALSAAAANQLQRRLWLELHQTRRRLVASDRMVSMGHMLEGISDAIQRPISEASAELARLPETLDRAEAMVGPTNGANPSLVAAIDSTVGLLARAKEHTERAARLLTAVREHTTGLHETRKEQFALRPRLEAAALLVSHRAQRAGVTFDYGGVAPTATLEGDPGQLEQILTASLLGFVEAGAIAPGARVRAEVATTEEGTRLSLCAEGASVGAELLQRLSTPRPELGSGDLVSGVGLFVARQIAEGSFGGSLNVVHEIDQTRLELFCPVGKAQERSRPAYRPGGGLGQKP